MKLFRRELKINVRPFLWWNLGMFVLLFAGLAKFTGLREGGEAVSQMMAAFPRPLQAMFGLVGVNIMALDGYYAVIMYYASLCAAIYGVWLGAGAVGRETAERTYEFLFTKPLRRSRILFDKLLAGALCLVCFCALTGLCSAAAVRTLQPGAEISGAIRCFTAAMLVTGFFFFFLSAMLSALAKRADRGAALGNMCLLTAFVLGMAYDMQENAEGLRYITPLRLFTPAELIGGELNGRFLAFAAAMCALFAAVTFWAFRQKDLQACS